MQNIFFPHFLFRRHSSSGEKNNLRSIEIKTVTGRINYGKYFDRDGTQESR